VGASASRPSGRAHSPSPAREGMNPRRFRNDGDSIFLRLFYDNRDKGENFRAREGNVSRLGAGSSSYH